MKSRAPLAMMEALVMLAVFALAAALCLQAFVKSDELSRRSEAQDRAALLCQSVAETAKHSGGDLLGTANRFGGSAYPAGSFDVMEPIPYTEDWTLCPRTEKDGFDVTNAAYYLNLQEVPSGTANLGRARVWVTQGLEDTLFELEFAWQEVNGRG